LVPLLPAQRRRIGGLVNRLDSAQTFPQPVIQSRIAGQSSRAASRGGGLTFSPRMVIRSAIKKASM